MSGAGLKHNAGYKPGLASYRTVIVWLPAGPAALFDITFCSFQHHLWRPNPLPPLMAPVVMVLRAKIKRELLVGEAVPVIGEGAE